MSVYETMLRFIDINLLSLAYTTSVVDYWTKCRIYIALSSQEDIVKVSDFVFRFNSGSWSGRDGICRVRTFVGKNSDLIAVLTDLGDKNPSASVTNSVETIRECLIDKGFIQESTLVVEH